MRAEPVLFSTYLSDPDPDDELESEAEEFLSDSEADSEPSADMTYQITKMLLKFTILSFTLSSSHHVLAIPHKSSLILGVAEIET